MVANEEGKYALGPENRVDPAGGLAQSLGEIAGSDMLAGFLLSVNALVA
jgi:hypothetical protein